MTLGGLQEGVSPLEMAYAYSTIANNGVRRSGSLAPGKDGPVGIQWVKGKGIDDENTVRQTRVFSPEVAQTAQELLAGVVSGGTGKAAQIGEFAAGKTGTTENYGDAWFVGFNKTWTVAVWVGYPDKLIPMETEYHGHSVAGGTFPAEIWHDFMLAAMGIRDQRLIDRGKDPSEDDDETLPVAPSAPATEPMPEAETGAGESERGEARQPPDASQPSAPEQEPPPQQQPAVPPATPPAEPAPAPAPGGGTGGGAEAP
jgi:penicillin-binding protein 1A